MQSPQSIVPFPSALRGLAPLFAIIFLGFLTIGIPLPALSLQVHDVLGFSATVVGIVVGAQSLVTVISRHRAGSFADMAGPKQAVLRGLPLCVAAGLLLLASTFAGARPMALTLLLCSRAALGVGESLFITGAMSWGIARIGPSRTGKVMAWQGIAMYGALGLGAMLGAMLQTRFSFRAVSLAATICPAAALCIAVAVLPIAGSAKTRSPVHHVLRLIWRQGTVLGLAIAPFAAIAAFLPLQFAAHGWTGSGVAMAAFATAYIGVRLFFAHFPDRFGSTPVALVSLAIEAVAGLLMAAAWQPSVAIFAAFLTGAGFSLMFPSMGVDATRRVGPEQRGAAVGNFIAFADIGTGVTGPLLGLLLAVTSYAGVFAIVAVAPIAAMGLLLMPSRNERTV